LILTVSRLLFLGVVLAVLSGCGIFKEKNSGAYYQDDGPPKGGPDPSTVANPVPRAEPLSKIGNSSYEVFGVRYYPMSSIESGYSEVGEASWYGRKFHGRHTSSGEKYDMFAMTAAHKTLPLPTYLSVKNLANQKEVIVRVNDRGPFLGGRILDLSYMAAQKLGVVESGTAQVKITAVGTVLPATQQRTTESSTRSEVSLQAASFQLKENAVQLRAKLIQHGISETRIQTVKIDQRLYYRVRAGPYQDQDVIREKITKIRSITGIAPKILVVN
jgi:rare lipoprotein A